MKKLSMKIVVLILFCTLIFGIALKIVFTAIMVHSVSSTPNAFRFLFIVPLILMVILFTVFALVLKKIVIKRIEDLTEATKKIASGKYETRVEVKGSDELSTLASNFNLMATELYANEYLNKDFIRNVSHEFKTPINSIKGYAELIYEEDNPEIKEYSSIIIEQSSRLANLSKSILQISQLDSNVIIKKDDVFSIDEEVRKVLQYLQLDWERKEIELELSLEELIITSSKDFVIQIIQNLVSNAIKFTNIKGKIIINLFKTDKINLQIIDNGIGIKEEDKDKIFKQFFVTDKSRNKSGSGLGLSIVKKIVDKLDGSVSFISEEGHGAKFEVRL